MYARGVFAATLTANDGVNAPVSDVAQVTIVSPNVPPTVNAGPDVSGQALDDISLHGTVTDPDSTPITTWTVDSPNCTFSDTTVPDTVINCDTPRTCTATLTADDGVNSAGERHRTESWSVHTTRPERQRQSRRNGEHEHGDRDEGEGDRPG